MRAALLHTAQQRPQGPRTARCVVRTCAQAAGCGPAAAEIARGGASSTTATQGSLGNIVDAPPRDQAAPLSRCDFRRRTSPGICRPRLGAAANHNHLRTGLPSSTPALTPPTPRAPCRRKLALQAEAQRQLEEDNAWWRAAAANLVTAATPADYKRLITEAPPDRLVVVDYLKPSCAACRRLMPKLEQVAAANPAALFVKVGAALCSGGARSGTQQQQQRPRAARRVVCTGCDGCGHTVLELPPEHLCPLPPHTLFSTPCLPPLQPPPCRCRRRRRRSTSSPRRCGRWARACRSTRCPGSTPSSAAPSSPPSPPTCTPSTSCAPRWPPAKPAQTPAAACTDARGPTDLAAAPSCWRPCRGGALPRRSSARPPSHPHLTRVLAAAPPHILLHSLNFSLASGDAAILQLLVAS